MKIIDEEIVKSRESEKHPHLGIEKDGDCGFFYNDYGYGIYRVTKEEWIAHFANRLKSKIKHGYSESAQEDLDRILLAEGMISADEFIEKHGKCTYRYFWHYKEMRDGKEICIGDGSDPCHYSAE